MLHLDSNRAISPHRLLAHIVRLAFAIFLLCALSMAVLCVWWWLSPAHLIVPPSPPSWGQQQQRRGPSDDCDSIPSYDDSATTVTFCRYEKAVKAFLPQLTCQHSSPPRPFTFSGTVCSAAAQLPDAIIVPTADADGNSSLPLRLSLPVTSSQLLQLRAVMEPSTVGFGLQQLLNATVRHSRQTVAAHGKLAFSAAFDGVLSSIRDQLWAQMITQDEKTERLQDWRGFEHSTAWQLVADKLLLYEAGDFFSAHRDVYKHSGQVLSVIVLLPTSEEVQFEGGELRVRRSGLLGLRSEDVLWAGSGRSAAAAAAADVSSAVNESSASKQGCDSDGKGLTDIHYSAFYSDCEHQLQAVTRGSRLAVVLQLHRM